jgi:plastocyanin
MKILARLSCAALAAVACVAPTGPTDSAATASNSYDVQIDGKSSAYNFASVAYFPGEVKAHPGDTIRFTDVDRGEPHTVTLGTMVEDAFAVVAKFPKDQPPPSPLPPEILRIPTLVTGQAPSYDLNPAGGQPCFLDRGDPPKNAPCPKDQQRQPEFTGAHSYFNSGIVPDRAVFAVHLADSLKPGVYNFLCLFHFPVMSGRIVVVDRSEAVPSPAEVKAAGAAELSKLVAALKPAVDASASKVTPGIVTGSAGAPDVPGAYATEFYPKVMTVPTGGSVTWQLILPHTISFNSPPDAIDLVVKAVDGTFHLNTKSLTPANSPPVPLPDLGGAGPPALQTVHIDGGAWDGKGYKSSGLIFSSPPDLSTYKITFTQPGTYTYKCLIHTDMEGTVKVGQ